MSSSHFISASSLRQPLSDSQNSDPVGSALASASRNIQRDPVLLGESLAIRRLRSQVQRIAPYFRTALIRGETGSGKQLIARAIHALSPGPDGPFIVANASALAESIAKGEPTGRALPLHPRLRGAAQRPTASQPKRVPPQRAGTD
jgi:DNA-binding NtrC family response regulator